MAKYVIRDAAVIINGINLSDHSTSAEFDTKKDEVDTTNFGTGGGKEAVHGLFEGDIAVDFQQDFAAASVDAVLWPLFNNETLFPVEIRPTQAAASATNPKYTAQCKLFDYQPISGKVGDLSTTKIKFRVQGLIAKATS